MCVTIAVFLIAGNVTKGCWLQLLFCNTGRETINPSMNLCQTTAMMDGQLNLYEKPDGSKLSSLSHSIMALESSSEPKSLEQGPGSMEFSSHGANSCF